MVSTSKNRYFPNILRSAVYMLKLSKDPGVGQLSKFEIGLLTDVCDKYAEVNDWRLAHDICHDFAEFKENYREGTSTEISLESIISAVGRNNDKEEILQSVANRLAADHVSVFHRCSCISPRDRSNQ